jgi:putative acetyltransferase
VNIKIISRQKAFFQVWGGHHTRFLLPKPLVTIFSKNSVKKIAQCGWQDHQTIRPTVGRSQSACQAQHACGVGVRHTVLEKNKTLEFVCVYAKWLKFEFGSIRLQRSKLDLLLFIVAQNPLHCAVAEVTHPIKKENAFHKLNSSVFDLGFCPKVDSFMEIRLDDLRGAEIAALLEEHLTDMRYISPPESKHALDLDGLRHKSISFYTVWENGSLLGCGAVKELRLDGGEIKSMRTANAARGRGVASVVLQHILAVAKERGYRRLYLETGAMDFFKPAHALYRKFGFLVCEPFGDYKPDPNSVFMCLEMPE